MKKKLIVLAVLSVISQIAIAGPATGTGATADATSTATGDNSSATNNSVATGDNSVANNYSTATGTNSAALATGSVANGFNATVGHMTPNGIAIGNGASALNTQNGFVGSSIAIGRGAAADAAALLLFGLAAGTAGTDAVNVNQLNDAVANIGSNPAEINRLDSRVDGLSKDIKAVEKRAYGGAALAMAMISSAPDSDHAASMTVGTAMFNGEGAIAGSLQLRDENSGAIIGLGFGVTTSQDVGVKASITWQWNPTITTKKKGS